MQGGELSQLRHVSDPQVSSRFKLTVSVILPYSSSLPSGTFNFDVFALAVDTREDLAAKALSSSAVETISKKATKARQRSPGSAAGGDSAAGTVSFLCKIRVVPFCNHFLRMFAAGPISPEPLEGRPFVLECARILDEFVRLMKDVDNGASV